MKRVSPEAALKILEVQRLSDKAMLAIGPLLGGQPSEIQSAVLADLTSRWLAGYQGEGKQEIREDLLTMFIELVRYLVPVNEALILEQRSQMN